MRTFKVVVAGVLFIACAASTSAWAVPFIAPVFGTPVVGIDFANPQFDVSISSATSTFFDFATADTFFRLTPDSPIVYDTSLRYSVRLESLPARIAEPMPAALIVLPLILLRFPWSAGRSQIMRGGSR